MTPPRTDDDDNRHRRSPDEIQRDIEATRAGIGDTLAAIERRLSPGQLLDQAIERFRRPGPGGQTGAARLGEVVKRNPLPATLIGIGVAWLAFAAATQTDDDRRSPDDLARARHRRGRRPPPGYRPRGAAGYAPPAPAPATAAGGMTRRPFEPLPEVRKETLMAVSRENLVDWLRDAYAMENQAVEILEKQASRLEHYPELEARVREHLDESKRQGERIEECLHRLGTDTSALKTGMGKLVGTAQQLSGLFASDEVIKSGIADYAFEHYEIACYKALIATAAEAGEPEVRRVCEENLREEQAMADWLSQHLPEVTRQYLVRGAAGQEAKR